VGLAGDEAQGEGKAMKRQLLSPRPTTEASFAGPVASCPKAL
jgi:hypothetical protein